MSSPYRPYIPDPDTFATEFPQHNGADLQQQVRLMREQHRRFFPALSWYSLVKAATPAEPNGLSGEPSGTVFDPLWGEVSPGPSGGEWAQPHGDTNLDATDRGVFAGPFPVHARVEINPSDRSLHHYGFDKKRDLLLNVPAVFFDDHGFRATEGDRFIWDGDTYEVIDTGRSGWWFNTSIGLFVNMNCQHARMGS